VLVARPDFFVLLLFILFSCVFDADLQSEKTKRAEVIGSFCKSYLASGVGVVGSLGVSVVAD
jgi:hypothetical protein